MIARAAFLVVVVVQVVIRDRQPVKGPEAVAAVVIEFLADKDMVPRFPRVLIDVGLMDIGLAAVLLLGPGGMKIGFAPAFGQCGQNARLA